MSRCKNSGLRVKKRLHPVAGPCAIHAVVEIRGFFSFNPTDDT